MLFIELIILFNYIMFSPYFVQPVPSAVPKLPSLTLSHPPSSLVVLVLFLSFQSLVPRLLRCCVGDILRT